MDIFGYFVLYSVMCLVIMGTSGQEDLESLAQTIPGVPGEDYPVFAQVPETSFLCDGQVGATVF